MIYCILHKKKFPIWNPQYILHSTLHRAPAPWGAVPALASDKLLIFFISLCKRYQKLCKQNPQSNSYTTVCCVLWSRRVPSMHHLVLVKDLMSFGAKIPENSDTLYENVQAKMCSFSSNSVWQCVMPSRCKYLSWLCRIEAEQIWSFTVQESRGEYEGHSGPLVGATNTPPPRTGLHLLGEGSDNTHTLQRGRTF